MRMCTSPVSGVPLWWLTPLRISTMERVVWLLSELEVDKGFMLDGGFMLIVASHRYFTVFLYE
jgi:hypothetical protein